MKAADAQQDNMVAAVDAKAEVDGRDDHGGVQRRIV